MKVNTDGVLLGALMTILPEDRNLLEIGTGTGTIALMAAQRMAPPSMEQGISCPQTVDVAIAGHNKWQSVPIHIDAIDIDEPSATEAASNFRNSPWSDILRVRHTSLEDFVALISGSFAYAGPDAEESPSDSCPGYDLIFSNPPYFDNALQAPEERRNAARHTATGLS